MTLGVPVRRKLLVFFFADLDDIRKIFGEGCGATTLIKFNSIVISNSDYVQATIRHELAHLLTARWKTEATHLLAEGIATWLAGSLSGQPIGSTAQAILLNSPPSLDSLLQRGFFFSKAHRHRCYILAASFTGYLIRRYGWEQYKRLYRHTNKFAFRQSFKQLMDVSLQTVEAEWHEYIKAGRWSKEKAE